jgi:predicted transcriptional regulator
MYVYVNLHPRYDYANMTINEGYIEELKEYVKNVEWLMWDFTSSKGKSFIRISGERHIERTNVVLQRLLKKGASIYIRNERADKWSKYKPEKEFSDDEMIEIEQQKYGEQCQLEHAERDLANWENMIAVVIEKGIEPEPILLGLRDEAKAEIEQIKEEERERLDKIANIWK